jgi:predicted sugar kinase
MNKWIIDSATDLPLAVIEDTADGLGIVEIGKRTKKNLAIAELIADAPNMKNTLIEIAKQFNLLANHEMNNKMVGIANILVKNGYLVNSGHSDRIYVVNKNKKG